MNSFGEILYFTSKYVNFVNSNLKEYLTKRSFIVMFEKFSRSKQLQEYTIKKWRFSFLKIDMT